MMATQSKLMIQLAKQQIYQRKDKFEEYRLEELYATICKIQPKNLMLVEFLTLVMEKGFLKNLHKLTALAQLYKQQKGKIQQNNSNTIQQSQQHKFNKKKFIKLLKQMAKKLYVGDMNAYEGVLYEKLTSLDMQDHLRIKIDENIKKYLTMQTIEELKNNEKFFESIFEVYMPQNYNLKLCFSWREIKLLQKKLPIICFLRFLYEIQFCPQYITPIQFFQLCNKLFPPINSNHKQVMFYYSQTITTYVRDFINLPTIKLIQGDIGLSFLQFQILMIRIATQYTKDTKQQFGNNINKFINFIKIRECINNLPIAKQTKFTQSLQLHLSSTTEKKAINKINLKKRQSKKKIQDLFDFNDQQFEDQCKKKYFETITISPHEIDNIRRNLDEQLPPLPQKKVVQQQNQGYYDINSKYIVIGQQLPKLQQKNKQSESKGQKKKKQDQFLGFKPQQSSKPDLSCDHFNNIIKNNKKLRTNSQFPIILTEILYPSMITSLSLNSKCQLYLETCYIHLGQRLFQQAYINFKKARSLNDLKSVQNDTFFELLEGQIYESACKDEMALISLNRAKDLSLSLPNHESYLKSVAFLSLGSSLYHLQEYTYAYRCFLKAKQLRLHKLQIQSIQNAIIQNNIGCCLMMINRNNEAIRYFQISEQIFDLKVGKFDERTLVAQQNGNKNRKAYIEVMPEFKTMWKVYAEKTDNKKAPKGKTDKKK